MNRINTFLVMLVLTGGSLSAKAQVYNEDDKEGLRMFLRQPSAISGQINAEQLGLDISDTLNWQSDETWVAKVDGLSWNTASPKRMNGAGNNNSWVEKKLAGSLDATKWTALANINCYDNELTQLNVSTNAALKTLSCNTNLLTSLDVSKSTTLIYLDCFTNQLTALDVSKNTTLTMLLCNDNLLTQLDVSKNTALTHLDCSDNQLTKLDVSKNTTLTDLECTNNFLPLSDLFAASEIITNQNNKWLGTQKISINANVGEVLFEGTEDIFKGITTQYSSVKKNGTTASSSDYTINNGTIQFNNIGKYEVTMTNAAIVSNSSLPAKVIATITVSSVHVQISGKITHQNQTPLTSGTVQLYDDKHKLVKDTTIASNGSYVFLNVANGDYRVRVEGAGDVLRTYYGNTQYWDSAKIVTIANNQSVDTVDITVIELPVLPKGTSFISGILAEDTVGKKQKGVEQPIVDESVSLQRQMGGSSWQTVAVARTDADGHFEFSDVPAATYRFSVDIMGLKLLDNKVTPVADGDTVEVELTMKEIGIETGIEELRIFNYELRVYPNPAKNELRVTSYELQENTAIEIYDIMGRTLNNYQFSIVNSQLIIDISHLAKGMYFLKIGNKVVKFVKE